MRKFFTLTFLLALSLNFISCDKGSVKNIDSINYGTSFGMCASYCVNNLSVSNENVTFSKSKHGQTPDTKTCTAAISKDEITAMKNLLDEEKIMALPERIGCPDCADGGAEWVSITVGDKTHKVVFEYGKAPAELVAVVVKFRALKETFKNCN